MGFGFVSGQLTEVRQGSASLLNATVVQSSSERTVTNLNYGSFFGRMDIRRHIPSDELHGSQRISNTPGTAVALGTEHVDAVIVKAKTSNAGIVYIGDSDMVQNQFELNAKEAVSIGIGYLGSVFIDVDNTGEGVSFLFLR